MDLHSWGGLALSTRGDSLLEGSLGDYEWFYAIGQYNQNWGNSTLASFDFYMYTYVLDLWIGISDRAILFSCFFTKISTLHARYHIPLICILYGIK